MNGATILPFPLAVGASASRQATSLPGAAAGSGFADAMDGALGATTSPRRDDPARRNTTSALRRSSLEPSASKPRTSTTPRAAAGPQASAPPHRATASRKGAAASKKGACAEDAASDESTGIDGTDTADDAAQDSPVQAKATAEAADTTRAGDAGAGAETADGSSLSSTTGCAAAGAATPVTDTPATTPATTSAATGTKAQGDSAQAARILRWTVPGEKGAVAGTHGQAGDADTATAKNETSADGTVLARARQAANAAPQAAIVSPVVGQAVDATSKAAGAATEASAATAPPTASAVPESATPQGDRSAGVTDAAVRVDVAAMAVAAAEAGLGGNTADAGTHDQPQPHTPAPAPHAGEGTATILGPAAEAMRFAVNVSAGSAAYASAVPGHEDGMLPQIVQSLKLHATQGVTEARVQLKPEHLGALNITLKVEQGQVTATIQADVEAVRQWIESHESSLRQALSEQGLQLARLVVNRDGEAPGDGRDANQPQRPPRRRTWRDEDVTFEVLV